MLRTAFKLPLRQTDGLLASVLTLMQPTISAADHTTVSRRAVKFPVIQPAQVPHGALHVLIDSTGLQVSAAGQCWRRSMARSRAGNGEHQDPWGVRRRGLRPSFHPANLPSVSSSVPRHPTDPDALEARRSDIR
jgi:hypothetical protein